MRSAIPYYILTLLDRHGSVHIPGVGYLERQVRTARVDDAASKVHPPRAQADFSEITHEPDEVLTAFITYRAGIGDDTAQKAVNDFAQQILAGLEAKESLHIEHFGTFSRRNGKVHLQADDSAVNLRYEGLEPVAIPVPVPDPVPEPEPEEVTESPYTPAASRIPAEPDEDRNKKRRRSIPVFIPLLIALFLAVCVFAYLQYRGGNISTSAGVAVDTVAEDLSGTHEPPAAADSMQTEQDTGLSLAPPTSDMQSSKKDTSKTRAAASDDTISGEQAVAGDSADIASDTGTYVATDTPAPTDGDAPEVTPGEDTATMGEDLLDREGDRPPQGEQAVPAETTSEADCVVVVGAFAVENNVVRMENRLTDMGYAIVKIPVGRLMQVGVPVACGSSDALTTLQELRRSVEAQAWLLKQ